jgi:hypothetical protein
VKCLGCKQAIALTVVRRPTSPNSKFLNWPDFRSGGERDVVVEWRLATFANPISRQNTFIVPNAKLPTVLRIAILFNISSLPFASGNLSPPADQGFWNLTSDPDEAE